MIQLSGWALALGASSGFGEATSLALARAGLNIFGVHLDRKATLGNVERIVSEIKALGRGRRLAECARTVMTANKSDLS